MFKWIKGTVTQLSPHFASSEFECPCSKCVEQMISLDLIKKLEEVRVEFGHPMKVTSGYRCPDHNSDPSVGGHQKSAHMDGLAADVRPLNYDVADLDNLYQICYTKFDNIGNGINKGFIHVDVRQPKSDGTKRQWTY